MANPPEIARQLERAVTSVVRRLAVNTTANLIETTPVDTGWARSNWIPSVGVSFDGNMFETSRDFRRALTGGAISLQQRGTAQVSRYALNQGLVYISNNVPYIRRLNEGSSSQAPAGFVQGAIIRTITELTTL